MELEELARKYALKNAVEYGGECNPGAVIGQLMAEVDEEPGKVQEVAGKICGEVNQLSLEQQEEGIQDYDFEEEEEEEDPVPDLEDTEDGVVVRFAPNPNGPAHMGSARGMVINGELKQKYDGKLILRFDDTDPDNKRPLEKAYEWYKNDYEWLGYEVDEVIYSSQHFEEYIEYAEELIEIEKAYVCECPHEKAKELKREGEACKHRSRSSEKNMERWKEMKNGGIDEGDAALKLKTDLDHKNPAVRDFFIYRIREKEHPRTGDEYRVYPVLDFAGAIEDHLMGTTHIIRGKDLSDSVERQKYIYDYFDWEYPNVQHWGRIEVSGFEAPMSTSSMAEMIEEGELEGWDDPRCGTLRALRRRGLQAEAIREFFLDMGVTDSDIEASIETLETFNTRVIDDEADRYFFVEEPVKIEIEDAPEALEADMRVHPEHPERGTRSPSLGREEGEALEVYMDESDLQDGFLRLKGLCNIRLDGRTAEYVEGDHTVALEKDADIVHWAPVTSEEAKVEMPDGATKDGLLEPSDIEEDEVVQFERFGFVRCDRDNVFYYTHG